MGALPQHVSLVMLLHGPHHTLRGGLRGGDMLASVVLLEKAANLRSSAIGYGGMYPHVTD